MRNCFQKFVLFISGVLTLIQKYFKIDSKTAGLLQTVFTCSYMVFAPIFGYLGDRYSRKYVMAIGIFIWSATTFLGSLVNKDVSILPCIFTVCYNTDSSEIYSPSSPQKNSTKL